MPELDWPVQATAECFSVPNRETFKLPKESSVKSELSQLEEDEARVLLSLLHGHDIVRVLLCLVKLLLSIRCVLLQKRPRNQGGSEDKMQKV